MLRMLCRGSAATGAFAAMHTWAFMGAVGCLLWSRRDRAVACSVALVTAPALLPAHPPAVDGVSVQQPLERPAGRRGAAHCLLLLLQQHALPSRGSIHAMPGWWLVRPGKHVQVCSLAASVYFGPVCCVQMGLGKTVQAIVTIEPLHLSVP